MKKKLGRTLSKLNTSGAVHMHCETQAGRVPCVGRPAQSKGAAPPGEDN
jgi:hypothetical protein